MVSEAKDRGKDQICLSHYTTHDHKGTHNSSAVWELTKFSGPLFASHQPQLHMRPSGTVHLSTTFADSPRKCSQFYLQKSDFRSCLIQHDFTLLLAWSHLLSHLLGQGLCRIIYYSGQ